MGDVADYARDDEAFTGDSDQPCGMPRSPPNESFLPSAG
jgi:hypothetical protein